MYDYAGMLNEIAITDRFQGRDAKIFHVMGRRAGFQNTTGYHDVAEFLNGASAVALTDPAGTENYEIVSSSAQDGVAGTGIRVVNIVYVNLSYAITRTQVTMNGLTPVQVGVLGARMILFMEAAADVGSNGTAVGNIDLRITSAGAIHERITAGGNKSLTCRFMVPDGYEAIVPSWARGAVNNDMDFRLRATVNTIDRSLCTVYRFQDNAYQPSNTREDEDMHAAKFPARTKIKVSCIPAGTAGTVKCDASFPIVLIAGD